jgi:hypothetical protein
MASGLLKFVLNALKGANKSGPVFVPNITKQSPWSKSKEAVERHCAPAKPFVEEIEIQTNASKDFMGCFKGPLFIAICLACHISTAVHAASPISTAIPAINNIHPISDCSLNKRTARAILEGYCRSAFSASFSTHSPKKTIMPPTQAISAGAIDEDLKKENHDPSEKTIRMAALIPFAVLLVFLAAFAINFRQTCRDR